MEDITNVNFRHKYPTIEEAVKKASFIAIDSEFSGIKKDNILRSRLV